MPEATRASRLSDPREESEYQREPPLCLNLRWPGFCTTQSQGRHSSGPTWELATVTARSFLEKELTDPDLGFCALCRATGSVQRLRGHHRAARNHFCPLIKTQFGLSTTTTKEYPASRGLVIFQKWNVNNNSFYKLAQFFFLLNLCTDASSELCPEGPIPPLSVRA